MSATSRLISASFGIWQLLKKEKIHSCCASLREGRQRCTFYNPELFFMEI
jgi:hypothetical protein